MAQRVVIVKAFPWEKLIFPLIVLGLIAEVVRGVIAFAIAVVKIALMVGIPVIGAVILVNWIIRKLHS